jgi:hypothetical protein
MQRVTVEGLLSKLHTTIDSLADPKGYFDREVARIKAIDEEAALIILATYEKQPQVALGMLSMYLLLEASEKGTANATT